MDSDLDLEELERLAREYENRTIYHHLDEQVIAGIADEWLEQAVIDYIEYVLDLRDPDWKNVDEIVASLAPGFPMVWYTWDLEGEVLNGGLDQYFYNHGIERAKVALDRFRQLGATVAAGIVEAAIATYYAQEQRMEETAAKNTIQDVFDAFAHSPFKPLDDEFAGIASTLTPMRVAYIRAHPDQFVTD